MSPIQQLMEFALPFRPRAFRGQILLPSEELSLLSRAGPQAALSGLMLRIPEDDRGRSFTYAGACDMHARAPIPFSHAVLKPRLEDIVSVGNDDAPTKNSVDHAILAALGLSALPIRLFVRENFVASKCGTFRPA